MRKTLHSRAFTLIELLVVVAIISILAGILFPVFARARENARRANCASNEKQQALGILMYAQDYDGRIMPSQYFQPGAHPFWWELLQPYVKSYQIFRCPDVHAPVGFSATDKYRVYWSTYALPGLGNVDSHKVIYSLNGTPLASMTEPSRTFMIVESQFDSSYLTKGFGYYSVRFDNSSGDYWNRNRHLGGTNVAFADGHVKWIKDAGTNKTTMQNWVYTLSLQK